MFSKLNHKRKGITLVEVILVLAIVGIVISLSTTMMIFNSFT